MAERYANAKTLSDPTIADTTLSAGIDAATTTIPLTSLTSLPAAAPFRILIDDELILITVRALSATGTRGIEGSTAATHAIGANVFHVLSAAGLANHPGALTTTGDLPYLASSGDMARLAAGSNGWVVRYASGLPTAAAIQAADLPDLSGTYQVAGSYLTAAGAAALTNKTGAISQWTNDAGYTTAAAVITYVGGLGYITSAASALLSATHTDTLAGTVVRGDLIVGNSTPAWARLAKPSVLSDLSHDGTDVAWVTATGTGASVRAIAPVLTGEPTIVHGTITTALSPLTITETRNASGVTFPGLVYDVTDTASAAGSLLLNLKHGGTSMLSVNKSGTATLSAGATLATASGILHIDAGGGDVRFGTRVAIYLNTLRLDAVSTIAFSSLAGNLNTGFDDVFMSRAAAAVVQFGTDLNGAAIAQTLQACNGITGTDKTGGDFTLASGKGTGAGAVSAVFIQTPTVLASGTTAQSLTTRLTINSSGIKATGYLSSDGSAGITGGPYTSVTVKNGLVVAGS